MTVNKLPLELRKYNIKQRGKVDFHPKMSFCSHLLTLRQLDNARTVWPTLFLIPFEVYGDKRKNRSRIENNDRMFICG